MTILQEENSEIFWEDQVAFAEEGQDEDKEGHVVDVPDDLPIVPQEEPPPVEGQSFSSRWRSLFGLILAFVSGLIFTGNNCVIQTFSLDFAETLLIRSSVQVIFIGLILLIKGWTIWPKIGEKYNRLRALIVFQGFWGGLMITCAFCSVLYLPLGDALTLIFSAPLSTMVMAAIFLGHRLRLYKISLGLILLTGTILVVRPPFIFSVIFKSFF